MATVLAERCKVAPNSSCNVAFSPAVSFRTAAAAGLFTGDRTLENKLDAVVCAAVSVLLVDALLCARCEVAEGGAELDRWAASRIRRAWRPRLLPMRDGSAVRALDSSIARMLAGLRRETEAFWLTWV